MSEEFEDKVNGEISSEKEANREETFDFIKRLETDKFEISIRSKKLKNPAVLLEEFLAVRENEELTNDEKIEKVKTIVNEYME